MPFYVGIVYQLSYRLSVLFSLSCMSQSGPVVRVKDVMTPRVSGGGYEMKQDMMFHLPFVFLLCLAQNDQIRTTSWIT